MKTLIIQHVPGTDPPQFRLVRGADSKATNPVAIPNPDGQPVGGLPNSNLVAELRWYLERFLDYPFEPETIHAERVLEALNQWGRQAFDALFGSREGGQFLDEATGGGHYERLHLRIASDDPRILAWPWEALQDDRAGVLALTSQVDRQLNDVLDPPETKLPRDQVNILLVTARPMQRDVRYRSISRPLIELIDREKLPVEVTVLRPPTLDRLTEHLAEHPQHYHILHFDGHGAYGSLAAPGGMGAGHTFQQGPAGHLVFEGKDGEPVPVSAETLSTLLREHAIPTVVLNACQSGMVDAQAGGAFASVAASLIKGGTRSVVAMSHSLYVSAAQQFLPAFYRRLFEQGNVAEAARAGRQQMYAHRDRVSARGPFPLSDWIVPVVYQQHPLDFSFAKKAKEAKKPPETTSRLPEEIADRSNPYGLIGRDGPVLELERALLRPPAAILIQGLGGIGKTTLARGFVEWLEKTEGLGKGCFWLTFIDIRTADYVLNRMGESLFGTEFAVLDTDTKIENLASVLTENQFFIVWDNFEVVHGIPGTHVSANLSAADQDVLKQFLQRLRGGASKVLITSRSREEWIGHEYCFTLPLGGLDWDERWEYCEAVLRDLNLKPKRDDPEMVTLMDLLGGHPLAMRAILPRLVELPPGQIAKALQTNLDSLHLPEDEVSSKLAATLRFIEERTPEEQRPLLLPLSLHEGFVDGDYLEAMAGAVDTSLSRSLINQLLGSLAYAGILQDQGQSVYQMHPALTGYLRATVLGKASPQVRDQWASAFVNVMAALASQLAPRELHDQRAPFRWHGANFHYAIGEGKRLGLRDALVALLKSQGSFAQRTRDFAGAETFYKQWAEVRSAAADETGDVAGAYHQLGMIAQERRDFDAAEGWYKKSLAIEEKLGNEHGAATTYHQLGRIAQERRDFDAAENWYKESLAIEEKLGNEHGAAISYHQLGRIAQELPARL